MKTILLDTNAYKQYLLGKSEILEKIGYSELTYLSSIVIGELYAGFFGGTKYRENVDQLQYVLERNFIRDLGITLKTAEIFGEIKADLKKKGKMIPVNDIWIAAQAIETGSELVTYNTHFNYVDKVRIWHRDGL